MLFLCLMLRHIYEERKKKPDYFTISTARKENSVKHHVQEEHTFVRNLSIKLLRILLHWP